MQQRARPSRRPYVLLLACLLVSLFAAAYPLYVIRPFRQQGPRELAFALVVLRFRPWAVFLASMAAVALAAWCWHRSERWTSRIAAFLMAGLTVAFSVSCRVNVYERMFYPLGKPAFAPLSKAKLDGGEQVIAVKVNSTARAYPIRIISYHHIVNDELGGLPIVATY